MNEKIIRELLDTRDFNKIMEKNHLYKYALLDLMRCSIYGYNFNLGTQEKEILMKIYRLNGCMFNINCGPVVFISDTHYDYSSLHNQAMNRWDFLYYVLDFCKRNNIHILIHGGDIVDGTIELNGVKKSVSFNEESCEIARRQVNNILNDYPFVPGISQLVLAGNHDYRYLEFNIDILRELASKKSIYPLGYCQAFFSVFNKLISLEHGSKCGDIRSRDLISHDLAIHGHSHIALFQDNNIYIPALGSFLNHKNEKGGEAGFLVMYPYNESDLVKLEFDHYYLKDNTFVREDNPYVYKLRK